MNISYLMRFEPGKKFIVRTLSLLAKSMIPIQTKGQLKIQGKLKMIKQTITTTLSSSSGRHSSSPPLPMQLTSKLSWA